MDKPFSFARTITIHVKDDKGNIIGTVTADENGAYSFEAEYEKNYALAGSKTDYFDGKNSANTFTNEQVVIADVILEKDPGLSLYALITDKKTGKPLEEVSVYLVDNMTNKSKKIVTPASGDFREALFGKKLNDRGSYICKARLSERARPGVVNGLGIWWRKLGLAGTNVNQLTSQRLTDLGRGPVFYDCRVEVEPATA